MLVPFYYFYPVRATLTHPLGPFVIDLSFLYLPPRYSAPVYVSVFLVWDLLVIFFSSNPLNNHKYRPSSDTYSCSDYVSQHMTNEKRSECTYPICLNTSISICVTPLASAQCTTVSYMHTQLRTYLLGVCISLGRSHTHTLFTYCVVPAVRKLR